MGPSVFHHTPMALPFVEQKLSAVMKMSHSCRGRVIAYGCLIRREGARREHLDYIYRGLMSQHPRFTATEK